MEHNLQILWNLLTALGIGFLIGIERGWKGHVIDEGGRVAGIRTFTLTGLLGGITGYISGLTSVWFAAAAFLGVSAITAVAHLVGSRKSDDIGITTEIALLITFTLGIWASFGNHAYVFGTAVVVVTLLGYKPALHDWIKNIEPEELYAGIKLLVISVILLPLLPNEGYGPWRALNPYWLWWMVVLITGLSFTGYVAMKRFGDQTGIVLTSVTGGLASSTAVTLSLAQMAGKTRVVPVILAGVLISSMIMFIRVVIEVAIVNAGLLAGLWLPLTVMVLSSVTGIVWLWKSGTKGTTGKSTPIRIDNPFQIKTALKFGLLLGLVVLLAAAMQEWFGDEGIYVLSLVSGMMDVDPIVLSLSKMAADNLDDRVATTGIVLAVISNTFVKGFIFAFVAGFRSSTRLLLVMVASGATGLAAALLI